MPTLFPEERDQNFRQNHPWTFRISDALRFSNEDEFEQARAFIDEWVAVFPEGDDKTDLTNRLLDQNAQFIPAFLELCTFAALTRAGFSVQPHPAMPDSPRRPDFLAVRGDLRVYVECTTANENSQSGATARRQDELLAQIQRSTVPAYSLVVVPLAIGNAVPSRRHFLNWVEQRLAEGTLDDEESLGIWSHDGWRIRVSAVPDEDADGERPIAAVVDADVESSTPQLVARIRDKQAAYGELDAPFLLVLGTNVIFASDRELWDALFGSIRWEINMETREVTAVRAEDGLWQGLRGDRVSAILFTSGLGPRSLRTTDWTLVHHPQPAHALPGGLLRFATEHMWRDGRLQAETPAYDFLGVERGSPNG